MKYGHRLHPVPDRLPAARASRAWAESNAGDLRSATATFDETWPTILDYCLQYAGAPRLGEEYELWFGPECNWRAVVTQCKPQSEFEFEVTDADEDWTGTCVGFRLEPTEEATLVRFHHTAWPEENEHFRISSFCWAMYLRILRRALEYGESVPYERRLEV